MDKFQEWLDETPESAEEKDDIIVNWDHVDHRGTVSEDTDWLAHQIRHQDKYLAIL